MASNTIKACGVKGTVNQIGTLGINLVMMLK